MTITQLEYIVAVDTYKSFAEASEHCFISQPTLSMQIKKLEETCGVLIFDRSKKPVLTTELGKKIIEQAKQAIKEFKRIDEIIADERGELNGTLRVGIIPTLSPYLLPLFATKFVRKHTKIRLTIEELLSEEIVRKVQNDQLDVGLMVAPEKMGSLKKIPLFYEKFLLYLSPEHDLLQFQEIAVNQLNLEELWRLGEGHCFRDQISIFCGDYQEENSKNPTKRLHIEGGGIETVKRMVQQRSGFTILPELATIGMTDKELDCIRHFSEHEPIREISIVVHRTFLKEKLIKTLKIEVQNGIPKALLDPHRGETIRWNQ